MKTKTLKIFFFFIVLIVLSFSVIAADPTEIGGFICSDTNVIYDNFNYITAYAANGWTVSDSCLGTDPPYTPYLNRSFGYTGAYCTNEYFYNARRFLGADLTTGTYILSFNFNNSLDTIITAGTSKFWHRLTDKDQNVKFEIKIGIGDVNSSHSFHTCSATGFQYGINTSHEVIMKLNLDTDIGSVYIDGLSYGCDNMDISSLDELGGIVLQQGHSAAEKSIRYTDNIRLCAGDVLTNASYTEDTTIETGELASSLDNLWDTFGLETDASRSFIAVGLMFMTALFYIGAIISAGSGVSLGAIAGLIAIEIIEMIGLVIVKLLPVWVLIVLGVIGAAATFFIVKNTTSE